MDDYKYEPLNNAKPQIRILTLHPLSCGPQLQGTLRVIDFETEAPPYEALSYVWGHNPEFDHILHLDSGNFKITAHLSNILTHIRYPDKERDIWVDAVCIDQDNHVEQGRQVNMMGDIYRHCTRDLAWLGDPPTEEAEQGEGQTGEEEGEETDWSRRKRGYQNFEFWLEDLRRKNAVRLDNDKPSQMESDEELPSEKELDGEEAEDNDHESEDDGPRLLRSTRLKWHPYWDDDSRNEDAPITIDDGISLIKKMRRHSVTLRDFGGHRVPARLCARLMAVFETRLWSRIWIVQELSCAKKILLLTETQSLSWKTVSGILARAHNPDAYHFPWGRGVIESGLARIFVRAAEIDKQREIMQRGSRGDTSTLLAVLARFCDRHSTDPRDRVYGLLGLIPPEHRSLSADYTTSAASLFTNVTAEVIRQSQSLDILCQSPWERRGVSHRSRMGGRTEGLPSWAVDFGAPELAWNVGESFRTREIMFAGDGTRKIFAAGGDLTKESWQFISGTNELQLRGYLLGQIGPAQPQPPTDIFKLGPGVWGQDITEGYYNATGEPKLQALCRTVLADCSAYPIQRLDWEHRARLVSMFRKALDGENTGEKDWMHFQLGRVTFGGITRMWERIELNWMFFVGGDGLFIMARNHVREGDYIAVIEGAKVPLILHRVRQDVDHDRFEIVSPAYVHGFMDGEAFAEEPCVGLEKRALTIV